MRVLVACEFSGRVRDAFLARGHQAWSCDLLDTEVSGPHLIGDVRKYLDASWDLMIAHPPCTYLTNAGVRHLHAETVGRAGGRALVFGIARQQAMVQAAGFFLELLQAHIPKIAIENPIPHRYARRFIGRYDQIIQPWQFGHGETKATCLWLKNLPPLRATQYDPGRVQRVHREAPGPDRWKRRSRTYEEIARAMAEQWG